MKFADLSAEDQALVNTDFGAMDKVAEEQVKVATEMYESGAALAENAANEFDKLAEDSKKEEEEEEEDTEKKAAADDFGKMIAEGFIDKLASLGIERHGNELHYVMPYVEDKVAAVGAQFALGKFAAAKAGLFAKMQKSIKGFGDSAAAHGAAAKKSVVGFGKNVKKDVTEAYTGKTVPKGKGKAKELTAMERVSRLKRPAAVAGGVGAAGGLGYLATRKRNQAEG